MGEICYPTASPALHVTPSSQAKSHSKIVIAFDGTIEAGKCFVISRLRPLMKSRQPTKIVVVGVEVFRRLASSSLDFGLFQPWGDGANHARRHLVLQDEDVLQCAIEAICPQVHS